MIRHRRRENAAGRAARQKALERMAVLHAAGIGLDQFADGHACRRDLHAGILDAARHREAAEALVAFLALRGEPCRAALDDVAHPVQRLDVLLERRTAEQADLRNVRRTVPRQAALAFDRFDHRGFFAADVGARAAPQMHMRVRGKPCLFEPLDLREQHQPDFRILVADIDIDRRRLDHPCADQHAFEEAMRIAFEIVAVLERAGFALVAVHRHQPRRGFGADQ